MGPRSFLLCSFALCAAPLLGACSKKAPKPTHTAPWLAHPSALASAQPDAATPGTPFHLAAGSTLSIELRSKQRRLHAELTSLSGGVELNLADPRFSHAHFAADLRSLVLQGEQGVDAAASARALRALELDADAGSSALAFASFELTALDDLSPQSFAAARRRDDGGASERRLRATATGDFSLHGFRVSERVPIEAELGSSPTGEPATLVIRSRAPFVVTLETHQIRPSGAEPAPREARVSFEFHLEK